MPQNRLLNSFALLTMLFAASCTAYAEDVQPTGRLIVEFSPDQANHTRLGALQGDTKSTNSVDQTRWAADHGLRSVRGLTRQMRLVVPAMAGNEQNLRYQAQRLSQLHGVKAVSVEYRRYPLAQPNDPLYRGEGMDPGSQSYLYEGQYSLRAPGAWDITTGTQTAVIAVVDTGVLPDHPEMLDRSVPGVGYDFVSPDNPGDFTSANDGDGRDNDPTDPGDHCAPNASSWHGTGVASVAAGNSNNSEGIAGIDWNARLLHARALGRCGGTDADIIDAIRWSAGLTVSGLPVNDTPATVINLSIGGPTECTPAWQNVIDELNVLGIPFVIAAGNEADNALRSSPANCADVITVGSNTPGGDIDSGFSNYGLKVTVAAHGRDILMATNDGFQTADASGNSYKREIGSSFSAAIVSGAISLMQSVNAELSPAAVRAILQQSATDFAADGDCGTYYCGAGILNLVRAVEMARDGDYIESDNEESEVVSSQLTALTADQPLAGALFGYRDMRYYSISVDQSGLLVARSDSDADLFGYLLDDRFSVLSRDDDSHTGFNFRVASLVEPGTYYLAVERSQNRRNDGETNYTLVTELTNEQPDPFTFTSVQNAATDSPVTSQTIEVSGLSSTAIITVTGGFYSLNDNEYTNRQGQVINGDKITVSLQSPAALNSTASLVLTVGAYATEFTVTTGNNPVEPPSQPPSSQSSGCSIAIAGSYHGPIDPVLGTILLLASGGLLRRPGKISARCTRH